MVRRLPLLALSLAISVPAIVAQQTTRPPTTGGQSAQQPTRDVPAQSSTTPQPTARITGRVIAADTGRPVKRARVSINAAELPGGRGVLTDDTGVFDFAEVSAGRYRL